MKEVTFINVSLYSQTISFLFEVTHHPLAFTPSRQDLCRGCLTANVCCGPCCSSGGGVSCRKKTVYMRDKIFMKTIVCNSRPSCKGSRDTFKTLPRNEEEESPSVAHVITSTSSGDVVELVLVNKANLFTFICASGFVQSQCLTGFLFIYMAGKVITDRTETPIPPPGRNQHYFSPFFTL